MECILLLLHHHCHANRLQYRSRRMLLSIVIVHFQWPLHFLQFLLINVLVQQILKFTNRNLNEIHDFVAPKAFKFCLLYSLARSTLFCLCSHSLSVFSIAYLTTTRLTECGTIFMPAKQRKERDKETLPKSLYVVVKHIHTI